METIAFLLSMLERVTTCGIMLAMDFATRFVKARTAMIRGASTDMRKVIGLALERFQASEGFCFSKGLLGLSIFQTVALKRSRVRL